MSCTPADPVPVGGPVDEMDLWAPNPRNGDGGNGTTDRGGTPPTWARVDVQQ
ncbi:MAG: hypothetical protein IPF99_42295 [Deltaproteobacteria bacterium]|nr:hypothetical protein [Deltaproteobacteria bacterium]